jgi:hypothetical protein
MISTPITGVFGAYIDVFATEKRPIGNRSLPELIPVIHFYDIPPLARKPKMLFTFSTKAPLPTAIQYARCAPECNVA